MNALFWLLLIIVLVALFGGAILGAAWWLLWYALVGLVIGAVARVLVRNTGGFGLLGTILCGIAGSMLGGWIGWAFDAGWLVQSVIAIVLAAVFIAIANVGASDQRRRTM